MIQEPTKEKDAGQFVCTAKNESGKLTATFTVKFEGFPIVRMVFQLSFMLQYPRARPPSPVNRRSCKRHPILVIRRSVSISDSRLVTTRLSEKITFCQADQNPEVIWLNPKQKKMKESSRIGFKLTPDGGQHTYTAQLELKVNLKN